MLAPLTCLFFFFYSGTTTEEGIRNLKLKSASAEVAQVPAAAETTPADRAEVEGDPLAKRAKVEEASSAAT